MRVDGTAMTNLVSSLGGLNNRQAEITNQLSSGVRLNHLSDDPIATGQAVTLADALRRDDAFITTVASTGNRMQAANTALTAVVTQLTSAVSVAVGAYNDSTSASARTIATQQLKSIRESLIALANSSYSGSYLFSGSQTQQPFAEGPDGTITYAGDEDGSSISLVSGGAVQSSLPGSSIFLAASGSVFGALNGLITNLDGSGGSGGSAALVGNLRDALANVIQGRATLNTAQKRLSGESDYISAQKSSLTIQQGTLLSADTASLATELSSVAVQRSALLSTIGLLGKDSLFDYLR